MIKNKEVLITYKDSNTRFIIKAVKEEQKKQSPETHLGKNKWKGR